ncbi:hypothetical protein EDC96DRAFT_50721 [Choanephora cucurbitarum]|nr:hypothetical protein EDC96DRAFT_50721 [Choanephora cucurbitarum]
MMHKTKLLAYAIGACTGLWIGQVIINAILQQIHKHLLFDDTTTCMDVRATHFALSCSLHLRSTNSNLVIIVRFITSERAREEEGEAAVGMIFLCWV